MRKSLLLALVLTLTGLLGACASNPSKSLEEVKNILTISLIGDKYYAVDIGLTAFNNEYESFDVSSWNLKEHSVLVVSELLGSSRFRAVETNEEIDLADVERNVWLGGLDFTGYEDRLRKIAAKANADAFLILSHPIHGDPFFGTNQLITGYGYYRRSLPFFGGAINYARISGELYDSQTLKLIKSGFSSKSVDANKLEHQRLETEHEKHKSAIEQLISDGLKEVLDSLYITREYVPEPPDNDDY